MRPANSSQADTIVAPATPPGKSAVAVVRLSGPDALAVARALSLTLPLRLEPRRAYLTSFLGPDGRRFDRGLLLYFPAPNSYTGEDMVEASLHGNPLLVRHFLDAAARAGARLAGPGEFSRRAVLNGKMNLLEAESIVELIEARTDEAARDALFRFSGALSEEIERLQERLLSAHSLWTASLDFPNEAGGEDRSEIDRQLSAAEKTLSRMRDAARAGRYRSSGFRTVLAGRPNSGKSTIFNTLLSIPRSIVGPLPGTTRDTIVEDFEIAGCPVKLVDTAGLRETDEPSESDGVERARREIDRADITLYIHDSTTPWGGVEREEFAGIPSQRKILIFNKADLSAGISPPRGAVPLCALMPEAGIRLQAILADLLQRELAFEASTPIVSIRQAELFARTHDEVVAARGLLEAGSPAEFAVSHLEGAIEALGQLSGTQPAQDTLDRVFSSFCIGK